MTKRVYLRSLLGGWWDRARFHELERFCCFVGTPRSGHSIVGAVLNAHPDAVIAHELGALGYLAAGFRRRQLFWLLLRRDREFTQRGSRGAGYDYAIPGQWQGRYRRLRVLGDKRAGLASRVLGQHPDLLDRVRTELGLPLRLLRVVRNPYDNIGAMTRWSELPLETSAEQYFAMVEACQAALEGCPPAEVLTLHHERFVADPAGEIERLCAFLELDCPAGYRDDCRRVVFPAPTETRRKYSWPDPLVERIARRMREFAVLRDYPPQP